MEEVNFMADVENMIDEATKRFQKEGFRLDKGSHEKTEMICALMEELAEESGSSAAKVTIHDRTKELSMTLVGDEFVADTRGDCAFFQLIRIAKSFKFAKGADGLLLITFNFGEMWKRDT